METILNSNNDCIDKEVAEKLSKEVSSYIIEQLKNNMETIEERAILNLQYEKDFLGRNLSDNMVCRAYVAGATEQKSIDEEVRLKKCDDMTEEEYERVVAFADWYHKNGKGTPTFSDAIEWARRELIDNACELLRSRNVLTEASIEGFRKVLEE